MSDTDSFKKHYFFTPTGKKITEEFINIALVIPGFAVCTICIFKELNYV